jgi:tetrathionate reductase subunit B
MKHFVLNLDICNGCYCCQIACKDEHVGNDWTPYAKPQPDTGQFWIKIHEEVRGTVPKVKVSYLPQMCLHCADAKCMQACKVEGAIYRREDGLIIIDPLKCTGCKLCPDACPYDAIYFNEDLNIAQKCTGCAHLLDDGWEVPRCVDACATGALLFAEEEELKEQIKVAEPLKGEDPAATLVHYTNLPKRFIAGTIYDPVEKEVIIGATCTLKDSNSDQVMKVESDNFGDFWFHGVSKDANYSLTIEKDGKTKVIENIVAEKDVNLGDIPVRFA